MTFDPDPPSAGYPSYTARSEGCSWGVLFGASSSVRKPQSAWARLAGLSVLCFVVAGVLSAQGDEVMGDSDLDSGGVAFFEAKIRPVLVEHCYGCHSTVGSRVRGGLMVDSKDGLLLGGDSGPAVVPGSLEDSVLWEAIDSTGGGSVFLKGMPPDEYLPDSVLADFRSWIMMGAPDPRIATVEVIIGTVSDEDVLAGRGHWSLQQIRSTEYAADSRDAWSRGTVDDLILARLTDVGLSPSSDASPRSLLRRLFFDITGLPPTPRDLADFERAYRRDPDQAVEDVVDRLLALPAFGERWGRHWLDVARYGESTGRELNASFPEAWRYRDWVIDSFNSDMPFDHFVMSQLAGDLLPENSESEFAANLVATGFLALGPKALRERNGRQFQADLVDEQIDVTTRAFLGLSVACARCHDHKFEAIQQVDYYSLAGIFRSTETYYGTSESRQNRHPSKLLELPASVSASPLAALSPEEVSSLELQLVELTRDLRRMRNEERAARRAEASSGVDSDDSVMTPAVSGTADAGALRRNVRRLERRVDGIKDRLGNVDGNGRPLRLCMGVQDSVKPQDARLLIRGESDQPGERVPRGIPHLLDGEQQPFQIAPGSSGRLEFAQWVASSENPLTARVFVNRVWSHLIGSGLVTTLEDFGVAGAFPSHPDLLDNLALRFINGGQSPKALVKEIALSRTYRQSSGFDAAAFRIDPDNRFLWRANGRLLEAEAIRDAMLSASGELELERPLASDVARLGNRTLRAVPPAREMDSQGVLHRSVYLPLARGALPHLLDVFDMASSDRVVGEREQTVTPTQGLFLLNDAFTLERGASVAARLRREEENLPSQIKRAFLLILCREPTGAERRDSLEFVRTTRTSMEERGVKKSSEKALAAFSQALFAASEFRILD
ncbi:MAG: hypothetical protein ACI8QS_001128 [Planctomycetota bacterium]